jgi:hypothetical protein
MTDDKDIRQQGTDFFENSVTISFFLLTRLGWQAGYSGRSPYDIVSGPKKYFVGSKD